MKKKKKKVGRPPSGTDTLRRKFTLAFGKVFLGLREKQDVSMKKLSLMADVSESSISRYEAGTRLPNLWTALRLCKIFNVSLNDFVSLIIKEMKGETKNE